MLFSTGLHHHQELVLQYQWFKVERDLWTSFRKYLVSALGIEAEDADANADFDDDSDDETDDGLLGEDEREEDDDEVWVGLVISLWSSSLIVSNIFDVLCLITVIYCGGATSMINLAIREFAIVTKRKKKKK